jgi:hypothetical protein
MYTIAFLSHWGDDIRIAKAWANRYRYKNQQLIYWDLLEDKSKKPDYWIIFNYPDIRNAHPLACDFEPSKTIILEMEPRRFWSSLTNEHCYLKVFSHDIYHNSLEWHLFVNTDEIDKPVIKTKNTEISAVLSQEYLLPGHIKRIDFVKYIQTHHPEITFDIYGRKNAFEFQNYKGPLPYCKKDNGMIPYKYHFNAENTSKPNYFTEKIVDAIVAECLCFYWGCPNISDYIDPRAYIVLDLDDFEKSIRIIQEAIENNEWEKRIDIIRKEKKKIMTEMNIYKRIEEVILNDRNKSI